MTTSTRPASTSPTTGDGARVAVRLTPCGGTTAPLARHVALHPLDHPHRRTAPSAREGGNLMRTRALRPAATGTDTAHNHNLTRSSQLRRC